jgi:hypothetical protein
MTRNFSGTPIQKIIFLKQWEKANKTAALPYWPPLVKSLAAPGGQVCFCIRFAGVKQGGEVSKTPALLTQEIAEKLGNCRTII